MRHVCSKGAASMRASSLSNICKMTMAAMGLRM
jgi:hypothetical protein